MNINRLMVGCISNTSYQAALTIGEIFLFAVHCIAAVSELFISSIMACNVYECATAAVIKETEGM